MERMAGPVSVQVLCNVIDTFGGGGMQSQAERMRQLKQHNRPHCSSTSSSLSRVLT